MTVQEAVLTWIQSEYPGTFLYAKPERWCKTRIRNRNILIMCTEEFVEFCITPVEGSIIMRRRCSRFDYADPHLFDYIKQWIENP